MPGRQFNSNGYKYGFNGKENDNEVKGEGNQQDYGMRIYDSRIGKFLSTDPIAASYAELTPYQFASNTPIQAIDLDGLEAFFIHGTWGNNSAWLNNDGTPNELNNELTSLFGNSKSYAPYNQAESEKRGVSASWSGGNLDAARQQAAKDMVTYIKEHRIHGEPVTIVGHSHGGNVAILVANMLAADPDLEGISIQLLTMNTPVREYQLSNDASNKTTHYQVFTTSDIVQTSGGDNITIGKKPGELFGAGREFISATNIAYDSPAKRFDINGNHQGWAPMNYKVWLPQLKKEMSGSSNNGGSDENKPKSTPRDRRYFDCFVKGTLITMKDGQMKPIENVISGDKILSVNIETMQIEEDEVLEIVSPLHDSIITLNFSDGNKTSNTFEHPYYIKGKGWCSYNPLQTLLKYGMKVGLLTKGDVCLKFYKNQLIEIKISSIIENIGQVQTYNLSSLKKNRNYFANGILVNNEKK